MKITVAVPSRARAFQLLATIRTAQQAESGKHEVTYIVGCDADDPETIGMCQLLHVGSAKGGPVTAHVFERTGSLGAMVNQLALDVPGDVYVTLPDDALIITKGWDQKIAEAWEAKPDGVWWWKTDEERPSTYAIISEKWRAASGRLFTDYFPFWWDDIWLLQVWILASGGPWLHIDAWLEDRPAKTHRMRDLRFWADFYMSRKQERIDDAKRIAKALGWPRLILTSTGRDMIDQMSDETDSLRPEFLLDAEKIERGQGETQTPPTPEYIAAKERAERLLEAA